MPGPLIRKVIEGGCECPWEQPQEKNLQLNHWRPSLFYQMSRQHVILSLNFSCYTTPFCHLFQQAQPPSNFLDTCPLQSGDKIMAGMGEGLNSGHKSLRSKSQGTQLPLNYQLQHRQKVGEGALISRRLHPPRKHKGAPECEGAWHVPHHYPDSLQLTTAALSHKPGCTNQQSATDDSQSFHNVSAHKENKQKQREQIQTTVKNISQRMDRIHRTPAETPPVRQVKSQKVGFLCLVPFGAPSVSFYFPLPPASPQALPYPPNTHALFQGENPSVQLTFSHP